MFINSALKLNIVKLTVSLVNLLTNLLVFFLVDYQFLILIISCMTNLENIRII